MRDFADAINEVLTMGPADRKLKHHYSFKYALTHTGYFWAKTFLQEVRPLFASVAISSLTAFKLLRKGPEMQLPMLQFVPAKKSYQEAEARLLLLDYDGSESFSLWRNPLTEDLRHADPHQQAAVPRKAPARDGMTLSKSSLCCRLIASLAAAGAHGAGRGSEEHRLRNLWYVDFVLTDR